MGACASVPKGMRAEAMAAPPPEHPKEENTTTATTTTAPEVVEVKEGSDNAEPKEDEKVAEEKDADNKHQSLGSLLDEVFMILNFMSNNVKKKNYLYNRVNYKLNISKSQSLIGDPKN